LIDVHHPKKIKLIDVSRFPFYTHKAGELFASGASLQSFAVDKFVQVKDGEISGHD